MALEIKTNMTETDWLKWLNARKEYNIKSLKDKGYFYNVNYLRWFTTDFPQVGSTWIRTSQHSRGTSVIKKGDVAEVAQVYGKSSVKFDYDERNDYIEIMQYQVRMKGSSQIYNMDNFKKVETNMPMMIETDRPTLVREFKDTAVVGGGSKREYIGDYLEFTSVSAARIYCSEQITSSIRGDNSYRQFAIFVENSVAKAKKPEIEFA